MTHIKTNYEGANMRITMTGHAGYNPGNDIVCAAESILMRTLLESLEGASTRYDEKEAYVEIVAPVNPVNILIWDTIKKGYRLLEKKYPQNVKLHR